MSRSLWSGIALILAALLLGIVVSLGLGKEWDVAVFRALAFRRADTSSLAIETALGITWLGDPAIRSIVPILAVVWLAWKRQWTIMIGLLLTIGIGSAADSMLKEIFSRARPGLVPHLDHVTSLSYPSGHAANSALIFLSTALLCARRWLVPAALLVLAIGVSRVLLGVHWPSDVIGGWMFGTGCALIGVALVKRSTTALPVEVGTDPVDQPRVAR